MRGNSLDIQKLYIGGNPASGGGNNNLLINGGLRVWQRAQNFSPLTRNHQYTADRWYVSNGTDLFANRRVAHSTAAGFYMNEMLLMRLNGDTATTMMAAHQRLEVYDTFQLRGKTVTFSGYIRCGASFSATDSKATLYLVTSSNYIERFGGTALTSGGLFPDDPVGSRVINSEIVTISTTSTRFSITVTVPADAWQLQVGVAFTPTGTASDTADWLGMKWLQLEVGDEPTEFEVRSLALDAAMCQRYYCTIKKWITGVVEGVAASTAGNIVCTMPRLPVTMRTTPSVVLYNIDGATAGQVGLGVSQTARGGASVADLTTETLGRYISIDATGATAATVGGRIVFDATVDAEL